jgi:hypothetical protein
MERAPLREALVFLVVLLLVRVVLVAGVGAFVEEREFSDDVDNQLEMIADPWMILRGDAKERYRSYPPLLPLAQAVFTVPLQWIGVSDFYAFRVACIAYEMLLALFVWLAVRGDPPRKRRIAMGCLVLLPAGWVTTAIFGQDEVIAAAFLGATVCALSSGRPLTALGLCGLGVVAGKIYLLLPLLALLLLLERPGLRARLVVALGPVVLVQGAVVVVAWASGTPTPLADWVPRAHHGVNLWPWVSLQLGWTAADARSFTAPIAVAAALAPLGWAWRERGSQAARSAAIVSAAMLSAVFAAFYHTTPEYFVLLTPLVLYASDDARLLSLTALAGASAWAANAFWAAHTSAQMSGAPGKQALLGLYTQWLPIAPEWLWLLSLVATTALAALLAWLCARAALGSPGKSSAQ